MKVYKISAVTLFVKNMEKSCNFYSKIPGFKLVYGGSPTDFFSTYEIGGDFIAKMYLNLELNKTGINLSEYHKSLFGRIIFHTDEVDELYSYLKNNETISQLILFENHPSDAPWGERYFHIYDPNGYLLSFAKPIKRRKTLKG